MNLEPDESSSVSSKPTKPICSSESCVLNICARQNSRLTPRDPCLCIIPFLFSVGRTYEKDELYLL